MKRLHLVVHHPVGTASPVISNAWHEGRSFERIYPVRSQKREDFERLARFLTGTAVGVVLGGGGARGFAHVGVLRALKERNIPVDLIGGNSMGALIGAQFACGVSLPDIIERTRAFARGGERLTLPLFRWYLASASKEICSKCLATQRSMVSGCHFLRRPAI